MRRSKNPGTSKTKLLRDARSLDKVMSHARWAEFSSQEVSASIEAGDLTLKGLRCLDRFIALLEERGLTIDTVEDAAIEDMLKQVRGHSPAMGKALMRALSHFFETPSLMLAIQAAITKKIASYTQRSKVPKPDGRKNRKRNFSLPVAEFPDEWRMAIEEMRCGMAGQDAPAPAPSVCDTLSRKVGELAKVTKDLGIPTELTRDTAVAYERSLLNRDRPLAAVTIHTSMVHIHHFAKYLGLDEDLVGYLGQRVQVHEKRLQTLTPTKQRRASLIPSYAEILERACAMRDKAERVANPKISQKLRNHAAAIALFCAFPLRVADTKLRFGESLLWTGEAYQIHIAATSKTGAHFHVTLHPFFAEFVDALILRGVSGQYLDQLRDRCLEDRRLLFINANGSAPHENYVSYAWKSVFGTGNHIARTKIHDEMAALGPRGVELALAACTHGSPRTAEYYRSKMFDLHAEHHVHKVLEDGITEEEWELYFQYSDD